MDVKPTTWHYRLILFVGHLINCKLQSNTIRSYVSAIKTVLREDGYKISEDTYLLSPLIQACKRKNERVFTRMLIQRPLLNMLLNTLNKLYADQPYLKAMYRALFSTAYFGLLRVGEVTKSKHVILAKDVHLGINKQKMMFILHSSITHMKCDKPQIIKITSVPLSKKQQLILKQHCPYHILHEYLLFHDSFRKQDEQFFIFRDRSGVSTANFRDTLHRCLTSANFDSENYSIHSFRAGRSCDLLRKGVSVETIQKLGHWKSNAVFRYLREF